MAVDTFTEVLRWAVGIALGLVILFVVGALVGGVVLQWWQRRELRLRKRVFDWMIDDKNLRNWQYPEFDEDWPDCPVSHVHMLDNVPEEWIQEWR